MTDTRQAAGISDMLANNDASLGRHCQQFGPLPSGAADYLIPMLEQARLTGRGGAGFPTARKLAAVAGEGSVVIGNGAEGEPLSRKDATLLAGAPHLVLDGLALVAAAVHASDTYLYVPACAAHALRAAIVERQAVRRDSLLVTVVESDPSFIGGEKSAVISRIEGGRAVPRDNRVGSAVCGVRGHPTLVHNVETLAHIALIARHGVRWFTALGAEQEPGTMLVTLSGALRRTGVFEVPTGTLVADAIGRQARTYPGSLTAVLVGGYHGTWMRGEQMWYARLSTQGGTGVIHGLDAQECNLARVAEVARYLAEQGAGQCGPCANGLPRLAQLLTQLAQGPVDGALMPEIRRLTDLVDGRGACHHPDGTARMVRSALKTFARDIGLHRHGRCQILREATQ